MLRYARDMMPLRAHVAAEDAIRAARGDYAVARRAR